MASKLYASAQEAGAALSDAQRRLQQQALEAAGVATASGEEEIPELKTHAQLEAALRRLFALSEKCTRPPARRPRLPLFKRVRARDASALVPTCPGICAR